MESRATHLPKKSRSQGAQLAINTPLLEMVAAALLRKERTCPGLSRGGARPSCVCRAEDGGRWSDETAQVLQLLAKAQAASPPAVLRGRTKAAWFRQWTSILACSTARLQCLRLSREPLQARRRPSSRADVLRDSRFSEPPSTRVGNGACTLVFHYPGVLWKNKSCSKSMSKRVQGLRLLLFLPHCSSV